MEVVISVEEYNNLKAKEKALESSEATYVLVRSFYAGKPSEIRIYNETDAIKKLKKRLEEALEMESYFQKKGDKLQSYIDEKEKAKWWQVWKT